MTRPFCVLTVACVFWLTPILAVDYEELRRMEVRTCQAIDPAEAQSGLMFNPDGYRSFYLRSKCFQDAAVRFRDATLCDEVRQRRSLLSSSWGYSQARCRQLVSEGTAADRRALEEMKRAYAAGGIRLRDFRIERNGNGRDVDIIPAFTGTYAGGYRLTFEILQPGPSGSAALVHAAGYYVDATSNLRLYVPQTDIRRHFPGFVLNREYTVRGSVTFDIGFGSQSGYRSNAFIERVFPVRERTHSMTRQAAF